MTDIRYGTTRDPEWLAMVTPSCVLVVDRAVDGDRAADLWSSVHESGGAQSVLDALTRGGISSTPTFAYVALPADFGGKPLPVTLIVRGGIRVSVHTSSEPMQLSGDGVSTWIEQVVPDAISVEIGVRDASGQSKVGPLEFVLKEGTAPIAWIAIGQPEPAETASAKPKTAAASSPAPASPPSSAPATTPAAVVDRADDPGVTITDPTFAAPPPADEPESGYDFLFGETVVRTVEGAAVRDEKADDSTIAGDHDGRTAMGLSAEERRAARQARKGASVTPPAPVAQFVLTFSTGEREVLDQPIIVGRAPSASKVSASSVPRLITVGGPDQDISRNHVQVSVEGGTVLVTDLHSRNGTMVTLPGRPPQQLRGGQPTAVISGALIDLGSGVLITVGDN